MERLEEEERKVVNYLLQEGDILIPARGTVIRTSVFHVQNHPCIANSNVIVIRPDGKVLDSIYLKIFLDSPLGNKMVSGLQQGTAVMNISYKDLLSLEIPVPSIEKQRGVAEKYTEALSLYQKIVTEAEKNWKNVLHRLQEF